MPPEVFLIALLSTVGIAAFTVIKVARLFTHRPQSPADEVIGRVEELERTLQHVQHELAETQERLDFTERLLSTTREERRIGD
jgi:hypothetical protein